MTIARMLVAGAITLSATSASAAWTSPGWYLVVDSIAEIPGVYGNRYPSYDACKPDEDWINAELDELRAFAFVRCEYVAEWMESDDPYLY